MRSLAFFSVFHPRRMGVADYSDDLVEALTPYLDVTCYIEDGYEPEHVRTHAEVKPHSEYRGHEDHTLYQVANSTELSFLLPHLVRHGGSVTLHDACQYDITYPYFRKHRLRFLMEVFRSLDPAARRKILKPTLNPARFVRETITNYKCHPDRRQDFSFTRFILRQADHLIVHSPYLRRYAQQLAPGLPIDIIRLGVRAADTATREEARHRLRERHELKIADDALVFLSFGAIQAHKRIDAVLAAFQAFLEEHPNSHYLLVGPRDPGYDLEAAVTACGVGPKVSVLDHYLPMEEVNDCIHAADLAFNLRWPSLGSTSSTLYKIFAAGRPSAITRADSFADYPADIALAVPPPGQGEQKACLAAMRTARDEPARLTAMGEKARAFTNAECSWNRIAERYAEALTRGL